MSWDSKATVRRSGNEPARRAGMHVVYLGLTQDAQHQGITEAGELRVGDSFRLLPGAAITFGRGHLCEVTIPSEQLSRAHAMISFVPGDEVGLVLVDLRSRNGTWVKDRSASVHHLSSGAEFNLARAFRFRCQPAPG
jgi:pSer/pThr/pTyr-binding forkhead associated (FHA) protein